MQILKFGGSSVANATAMSRVLDITLDALGKDRVVLVSSAISGATDLLIKASQAEGSEKDALLDSLKEKHFKITERLFSGRECTETKKTISHIDEDLRNAPRKDYQTYGELFSTMILSRKLASEGINALWLNSPDLIRVQNGVVDRDTTYKKIKYAIDVHPEIDVFVAPGFIASDETGHICTLGRGGSDYSAALFAAALDSEVLQIWTDVPGIMTTNPKDVKEAHTIPQMSYRSAFTLASHGAKVLYAPTVQPAQEKGIDIQILNSLSPSSQGTVIRDCGQKTIGEWVGIGKMDNGTACTLTLVADGSINPSDIEVLTDRLSRRDISLLNIKVENDFAEFIIPSAQGLDALCAMHYYCFETDEYKNIYLAGKGAVGKALLKIIDESDAKIEVRAISEHECEDEAFFQKILAEAASNSVFVDCTDSESIWKWYAPLLEAGVNVVSSNRRALSVPYANYAEMKRSARLSRRFLRYETTVGTALPVLDSIATSTESADEIISIEAIVSCTLNYVLTSGLPFRKALEKAREAGLTEKDPSADLLGRDASRKLLILAREAGVKLEEEDIEVEPVKEENIGKGQRFVASLEKDPDSALGYKASIRLKTLAPEHPALRIKGTENMIIISSTYQPTPLIIQGAGEGAMMAASRLLTDIMR